MAIKSDFHVHSTYSGDAESTMEEMVLRGIELGLDSICFTDHMDIDFPYDERTPEGTFELNTDSYLYELLGLRSKYEDKIKVLFGVEIGVQPHLRRELALYAKAYDFDFIIGSAHLLNHEDPYYPDVASKYESDEALYRAYFKEVMEDLKVFSNFDVFGHLDYIVRYGITKDQDYSYDKYKDCIDPVLEKLIDMEKAIELNTGALSYNLKDLNPCKDILKRYRELGGEIITIGSDAHNTKNLARGFDIANQTLMDCGFKYYCTFEKRVAEFHKLV